MLEMIYNLLSRRLDKEKREVIKLRWELERQKKLLEKAKRQNREK